MAAAEQTGGFTLDDMLELLEEVIRKGAPEGEVVTHWDLIVETRCLNHPSRIKQRRYAPEGSNPYLTLGILDAMVAKLRYQLGPGQRG